MAARDVQEMDERVAGEEKSQTDMDGIATIYVLCRPGERQTGDQECDAKDRERSVN